MTTLCEIMPSILCVQLASMLLYLVVVVVQTHDAPKMPLSENVENHLRNKGQTKCCLSLSSL